MQQMLSVSVYNFGAPEVLQLERVPAPLPPPKTFRVKIKTAGLNPVEVYIREGSFVRLPSLPYIPGKDFCGVIDLISPELEKHEKFHLGSRVYGMLCEKMGTYCEYCIVDPSVDCVDVLPPHVDFDAGAAATTTYLTAYRALFQKANCKPNNVVLVHGGSGGVGTATIEMAKHRGANVIATAGTNNGMLVSKSSGANQVFNHSTNGYENEILEYTQGVGVDIIIENAAHLNLERDLQLLKKGGIIVIVGCRGMVEINARECMARESIIKGLMLYNASENELKEAMAYIQSGLASKSFNPIIQTFGIEEVKTAHRELITPSSGGAAGRMVLKIS